MDLKKSEVPMGHLDSPIQFNEEVLMQMAHDMRAPLQALKAVLGISGELDERKKTLLKNSIVRLEGLAEGILNQNSGATLAQPECFVSSAQNIIEEFRSYSKCNINLHIYSLDSRILMPTELLRTLERILSILISNAVEASQDCSDIRVSIFNFDEKVVIEVKDQGCGMSEQDLKQIGTKGFTKNKKNGHGLGLAFIQEKVKDLKGKVEVISKKASGTTFKIEVQKTA